MTLRRHVALVRGSYWPVVLGLMTAVIVPGLAVGIEPRLVYVVAIVAAGALTAAWVPGTRLVLQRVARQHQARLDAALDEGDTDSVGRLLDEVDDYLGVFIRRSERQQLRVRGQKLSNQERWSEALALVGSIDREKVPASERPTHDNALAWLAAHAGETARAVELARGAADASSDARTRPYLLGTLGTALVLDGQHAAALAPLREALALGGPRWAQAVRRQYRGEALAALGRLDEARAEWRQAVTIAPRSRWGRRAQARLEAGAPAAYR